LNDSSPQSELAPVLLQEVTFVLQDKHYVDRLKRHYHMFKEAVSREGFESEDDELEAKAFAPRPKIGRNDPCPCGSGKKYKNCCGTKARS
jgi:preprotein translocase subunit SecA